MNPNTLISPEILVPRLGDQLVKMGLISAEQLKQALEYQDISAARGKPCLLGQALIDLNLLDRPTLDRAVTDQIYRLRSALEDANRNLEARVQQRTIELEAAMRRLAEINQLKANFVANVSHELRTPLTHIHGYLDLLFTESLGDLNEDQKKALDVSLRASVRLESLIDDLILFAQASRGELNLTLEETDIPAFIQATVDRLRHRFEDKQVELTLQAEDNLPAVQADREKLSWVITQLLDNALKFTPSGGKVSLFARRDRSSPDAVRITVQDTGIGIATDRISEIFEPFHQLDGSPTRRYGGTGLGLSLALQIIESHGSSMDVRSEPNKGTIISFILHAGRKE